MIYPRHLQKYANELDTIAKITNNEYIYKTFYNYYFTIEGSPVYLDSNINIYEAGFISLLMQIFITNKDNNNTLNVLEIGCAYGTSSIVIANMLVRYKYRKSMDIVDPNQSTHWKNIGLKNIAQFLQSVNKKLTYTLYEKYSEHVFNEIHGNKKYDIIFIDGSHDEKIVIQDLTNSANRLNINGLIIVDDVLHAGVKKAIFTFIKLYGKQFQRVIVADDMQNLKLIHGLYNHNIKRSFTNPNTMYCFMKKS